MAKFIFRLQNLFELKQKLEEQQRLKYGESLAALEIEQQKLNTLQNDEKKQIDSLKTIILEKSLNPQEMNGYHRYLDLLKDKIAIQEKKVSTAAEIAEQDRVKLVDAMKERKTLETLKEKAREEYLREEQLAEQKIVDEIVSYKYNA